MFKSKKLSINLFAIFINLLSYTFINSQNEVPSEIISKARGLILEYAQISYDLFSTTSNLYDELENLHDSKFGLSSLNLVDKIFTKKAWKESKNLKAFESSFESRFESLVNQSDFLILDRMDENKLCLELKNLSNEINFLCFIAKIEADKISKENSTCISILNCIKSKVEKLKSHLVKLQNNPTPIKWLKNNLWGSHFSVRVLPIMMKIFLPVFGYYKWTSRTKEFYESTQNQKVVDEAQKMLTDAKAVIMYQGGASKDAIVRDIVAWFWDLYERAQEEDYKENKDEEEKKNTIARALKKNQSREKEITFDKVIGYEKEKQVLKPIIDSLINPLKFKKFGVKTPSGILFYGPPGTGKTLFARAIAGEAKCKCWTVNACDLLGSRWISSEDKINELFNQAEEAAPSVIFIDELDFIGSRKNNISASSEERTKALANLLTKLSGFKPRNPYKPVLVIAATNYIEDLDEALIRAGRFDIQLSIGLPDIETRKQIIEKELPLNRSFDTLNDLVLMTEGKSCAEILSKINQAKLFAATKGKIYITTEDLEDAFLKK